MNTSAGVTDQSRQGGDAHRQASLSQFFRAQSLFPWLSETVRDEARRLVGSDELARLRAAVSASREFVSPINLKEAVLGLVGAKSRRQRDVTESCRAAERGTAELIRGNRGRAQAMRGQITAFVDRHFAPNPELRELEKSLAAIVKRYQMAEALRDMPASPSSRGSFFAVARRELVGQELFSFGDEVEAVARSISALPKQAPLCFVGVAQESSRGETLEFPVSSMTPSVYECAGSVRRLLASPNPSRRELQAEVSHFVAAARNQLRQINGVKDQIFVALCKEVGVDPQLLTRLS